MLELDDDVVWVDVSELVCPGCGGPVVDAPPSGWPARAGAVPEFSHPDGSVLCPDELGRVGEPVEISAASTAAGVPAGGLR
ncbi:hypothetical protein AFB00_08875 [Pseudonocardia sp. HH130630-07]|nr:hypothetical protein AFB00_08875 [Pseudonocardia sp. HH130630-07]